MINIIIHYIMMIFIIVIIIFIIDCACRIKQHHTHQSISEHHVFQGESVTECVCSQLQGVVTKCYTAL